MLMDRTLDNAVQVISFSEARQRLKAVLDRVEADADVTLITRRHAKGAVVMSLDTTNSLMETVHLLRSPANAAHLQRSLEQAGRGELPLPWADRSGSDRFHRLSGWPGPLRPGRTISTHRARTEQLRRINQLIQACLHDPFAGIGKPEPLRENLAGC